MTIYPTDAEIDYQAGDPAGAWTAAVKQFFDCFKESLGAASPLSISIATGIITPTRCSHLVDTEASAASDDLSNIVTTNIPDGRWMMLRPASLSRVVTIKHLAGGAGQIRLLTGADYVFGNAEDFLVLERSGDDWWEVFRRYEAPPGVASASESTPGVAEIATQAEVNAGTDDARFVTPLKLAVRLTAAIAAAVIASTETVAGIAEIATQAEVNTGTDDQRFVTPLKLATKLSALPSVPSGTVTSFAGSAAPSGWLLCYGQAVSRSTYASLFAAISTTYGAGDGTTTFNLPDLRGRVAAGKDDMGGTAASRLTSAGGVDGVTLGAAGGDDTHTLTLSQMPAHTHSTTISLNGSSGTGGSNDASKSGYTNGSVRNTDSKGSGNAHPNVQPTIVLTYIIKT